MAAGLLGGCASGEPGDAADGYVTGAGPAYQGPAGEADTGTLGRDDLPGEPVADPVMVENDWVDVAAQPVSTFSSDVDTASYTMLRYMLGAAEWYEGMGAQFRIEEMINYFDYDYAAPAANSARPFNVDVKLGAAPWDPSHQIARIGVKAKEARPTSEGNNVVLLIDTSGSMSAENKLPLLVESFKLLAEKFDHRDRISLITYAGSSSILLDGATGTEHGEINRALESLTSAGATAGADALKQAYALAAKNFIEGGNNRVVLATDGDFNVGPSSVEALKAQITQARSEGVFISVFGFGMYAHDAMMETIADNGNGNYFYIDSMNEARRALVDQFDSTMFTVAKDLKLQVTFNPQTVARYRLIGYENRVLANEDFADDAVDAGDVGAGATVTALYELVPGRAETAEAADAVTAAPADGASSAAVEPDSWMTVSTRYKAADGDESKQDDFAVPQGGDKVSADDDWRFAVAVAEFGLILRDSQHRGAASLDQVKSLAEAALGEDPYGLRAEFVELVERYRELTS
jgi:Ca-activated chloride channel family protein